MHESEDAVISMKQALPWFRFVVLLGALSSWTAASGQNLAKRGAKPTTVAGYPAEKALALGERMYREGVLPDGTPMRTGSGGEASIAGTTYTCASCHLRSGLGSNEGGVVTLPINGYKLGQARYWKYPNLQPEERKNLRVQTPIARPPYDDATLAKVLRTGIDPTGRTLNQAMPRFDLSDGNMAILIHYLWSLSADYSPGADKNSIRFATVITDEVSAEDQDAMLIPINNYIARHNSHAHGMDTRMYGSIGGEEMIGSFRTLSVDVWRLKGAPETWNAQLEAYLARGPVFALLGGISYREWKPIHDFCEKKRLPCLFPITDLPVVSDSAWYTQYFSKGYFQEGEAAARFLGDQDYQSAGDRVLQIIQAGPEARDLAAGFREAWKDLGKEAPKEIQLKPGELLTNDAVRKLLEHERPTALVLWQGNGASEVVRSFEQLEDRPGGVIVSSRLLGSKVMDFPEKAWPFIWITYPYREPLEETKISRQAVPLMKGIPSPRPESRISTRTYSMLMILQAAMVEMDRNIYRDNLLDRIGLLRDYVLPDYVRLSFGPGQRYASKGCYIMQILPGKEPRLWRSSEWVIQ